MVVLILLEFKDSVENLAGVTQDLLGDGCVRRYFSEDVNQEQARDHHDREGRAMDREGCSLRTT